MRINVVGSFDARIDRSSGTVDRGPVKKTKTTMSRGKVKAFLTRGAFNCQHTGGNHPPYIPSNPEIGGDLITEPLAIVLVDNKPHVVQSCCKDKFLNSILQSREKTRALSRGIEISFALFPIKRPRSIGKKHLLHGRPSNATTSACWPPPYETKDPRADGEQ
ncbi:hypothetical protein BASA81_011060 [Batrachochytrium salamandrivorans]|nr:hypothetical protein BASA81_011060 [Batrachochytrium salamandrivorans]